MFSRAIITTLSSGRQSMQTLTSRWMGRSITQVCRGCDFGCPNLIKAAEVKEVTGDVDKCKDKICTSLMRGGSDTYSEDFHVMNYHIDSNNNAHLLFIGPPSPKYIK